MIDYKTIDNKIKAGYEYIRNEKTIEACDSWLEAWDDIKLIINESQIKNIEELETKYDWSDFLINYTQDLEAELHNAGLSDKEYYKKRITYCQEVIPLYSENHWLCIENSRRAIADSYYEIGDTAKCDELYSTWLNENPDWGYGYIGWADCYWFDKSKNPQNLEKAAEILKKAVGRENARDRFDILERAVDLFAQLGNTQELEQLKIEFKQLNRKTNNISEPIRSEKTGRNDPCPCGSGRKYKKCCG